MRVISVETAVVQGNGMEEDVPSRWAGMLE